MKTQINHLPLLFFVTAFLIGCNGKSGFLSAENTDSLPVIDISNASLTKEGAFYGVNATGSLKAKAQCEGCIDQNFQYRWIIDVNEDGVYDESNNPSNPDIVQPSANLNWDKRYYAKNLKLVAQHAQINGSLVKYYFPDVLLKDAYLENEMVSAVLMSNGKVISWGEASISQQPELTQTKLASGVTDIVSTIRSFAALKDDGSVVTWGIQTWGVIQTEELKEKLASGVVSIHGGNEAFVAIKEGGSAVTWGKNTYNSQDVAEELKSGVVSITTATSIYDGDFFVALKDDGKVIIWGEGRTGNSRDEFGWASGLQYKAFNIDLDNVKAKSVHTSMGNGDNIDIAVITEKNEHYEENAVVTWSGIRGLGSGVSKYLPRHPTADEKLRSGVVDIVGGYNAFAALTKEGEVVTWGFPTTDLSYTIPTDEELSNITKVYTNTSSFAALQEGGSVITWGKRSLGGDSSSVDLSSDVVAIYPASKTFGYTALKSDGSAVTWGMSSSSTVIMPGEVDLSGIEHVYHNETAYAAIKEDGSVVTWGYRDNGGDSSSVSQELSSNVMKIFPAYSGFIAIKNNGLIVYWGKLSPVGPSRPSFEDEMRYYLNNPVNEMEESDTPELISSIDTQ